MMRMYAGVSECVNSRQFSYRAKHFHTKSPSHVRVVSFTNYSNLVTVSGQAVKPVDCDRASGPITS